MNMLLLNDPQVSKRKAKLTKGKGNSFRHI